MFSTFSNENFTISDFSPLLKCVDRFSGEKNFNYANLIIINSSISKKKGSRLVASPPKRISNLSAFQFASNCQFIFELF
jgi:hypothetical protein